MQEREKLGTVDVPIQNIVKGMNRNQSSTTLEPVEFLNLYNYFSAPQGLIRAGVAQDRNVAPGETTLLLGTSLTGGGHFSFPFSGLPAIPITTPVGDFLISSTLERYPDLFGNYEDMVNTEFNSGEKRTFLFSSKHIFKLDGSTIKIVDPLSDGPFFYGSHVSETLGFVERITPVFPGTTRVRISRKVRDGVDPLVTTDIAWKYGFTTNSTVLFEVRQDGLDLGFATVETVAEDAYMGIQYAANFSEYSGALGVDVDGNQLYQYLICDFTDNPPPFDKYGVEILDWQFVVGYQGHSSNYDYLQFNDTFYFSDRENISTKKFGSVDTIETFLPVDWKVGSTLNLRGFGALASHRDRVIVGNTYEDEGVASNRYPMRIRWTQPYAKGIIEDDAYYDFNEYGDEILEIVPYLDTIWVFMKNAIYIGRIAGIPNLPYVFTKLPTAGVGITSRRAVSVIDNNILFVGRDDIYRYNSDEGLARVGTRIFNYLKLDQSNNLGRSVVAHIPERQTVAFLFRSSGETSTTGQLWGYNLITNAWSILMNDISDIAYAGFTKSITFDGTTATFEDLRGTTFLDTNDTISDKGLVLFRRRSVFAYLTQRIDANSDSIFDDQQIIETADLNFGLPNVEKIATRLSIALADSYQNSVDGRPLIISLSVSSNRGLVWKDCGTISIPVGKNEGKVDFRATGSTLRFRLSTKQVNSPYTITEYALRVRSRGIEVLYK